MFKNLHELIAQMPDEKTCRDYLVQQRWNGKPVCPYCGCDKSYVIEGGKRFRCADRKECGKKYSVTVGTVFHASNIPLTKWFMACYLVTAHKKGISSYQLGKDIGVAQKSAWFMIHRLREMMKPQASVMLDKIVEIDETWNGGSVKNKHKSVREKHTKDKIGSTVGKAGIMGYLQREGTLKLTLLDIEKPIKNHVRENVAPEAIIVTDGARAYRGLDKEYERHEFVDHRADEFVRDNWHTNGIEGAFGLFKRMVIGIYHQVTAKHLESYLNEFTYRYNSRQMKDAERFNLSLTKVEGRLSYKTLTGKK
jgi:transposase-like protein